MNAYEKAKQAIVTLRALGIEPQGLYVTPMRAAELRAEAPDMGQQGNVTTFVGVPLVVRSHVVDTSRTDAFDGATRGFALGI